MNLHVGAERGVDCEHMHALVTNFYSRGTGNGRRTGGRTCKDCTDTIRSG